jgi:hypothetical protein
VASGSQDAVIPDWYSAFAIAEKLRCSVMDLATTPEIYQSWAYMALSAEAKAQQEKSKA